VAPLGDARDEKPCNVAMKNVLTFDAVADAATGMALLIVPSLIGRLLFGKELTRRRRGGLCLPEKDPCTLNASVETCQPFSSKKMMLSTGNSG